MIEVFKSSLSITIISIMIIVMIILHTLIVNHKTANKKKPLILTSIISVGILLLGMFYVPADKEWWMYASIMAYIIYLFLITFNRFRNY
ncbi:MAG: hypothetical protein H3C45_05365 [Bacteroidia bacterium]|nr:hypothetical protein [Bacteroidia bacterium]